MSGPGPQGRGVPAAVWAPAEALTAWEGNPRVNAAAIDPVARSMARFGFGAPIVARAATGEVIAGHTRLAAFARVRGSVLDGDRWRKRRKGEAWLGFADAPGPEYVPVRYLDVTEEDAHALALADNRLGELSEWDDDALSAALTGLAGGGSVDLELLGWSGEELSELLAPTGGARGASPELDLAPVVETSDLTAPFPWFGGKSRAAGAVWYALGDVENYVEPFAGSAAVLLARPRVAGVETINDADGFVANLWRAIASRPDEVAAAAAWPVSEVDLTARHLWLVGQRESLVDRLQADPEWCDPKIAGWWVWGVCSWIGSGWCAGDGPWALGEDGRVERRDGVGVNKQLPHLGNAGVGVHKQLPHLGNAGRGVHKQLPHLGDAGRGVNKKLPHLGNAGRGVNKKLPHLGDAGRGVNTTQAGELAVWFEALAARLRRVRVACGDWSRVTTPAVCERHGLTGVLLDPPYPEGWSPDRAYAGQEGSAAEICAAVFQAAVELSDRGCRVVVCGYEDTWSPPPGWTTRRWLPRRGYAQHEARLRDVLWCSPGCVP